MYVCMYDCSLLFVHNEHAVEINMTRQTINLVQEDTLDHGYYISDQEGHS